MREETREERKLVSPLGSVGAPGLRARLNRHRHRFRQPSLFVSSGNAKGKGALPLLPAASSPSPLPHSSSSFSLPVPWNARNTRAFHLLSCARPLEIRWRQRENPSPILLTFRFAIRMYEYPFFKFFESSIRLVTYRWKERGVWSVNMEGNFWPIFTYIKTTIKNPKNSIDVM